MLLLSGQPHLISEVNSLKLCLFDVFEPVNSASNVAD